MALDSFHVVSKQTLVLVISDTEIQEFQYLLNRAINHKAEFNPAWFKLADQLSKEIPKEL